MSKEAPSQFVVPDCLSPFRPSQPTSLYLSSLFGCWQYIIQVFSNVHWGDIAIELMYSNREVLGILRSHTRFVVSLPQ